MTTYIEYKLDENTTILVEAPEDAGGGVHAAALWPAYSPRDLVIA